MNASGSNSGWCFGNVLGSHWSPFKNVNKKDDNFTIVMNFIFRMQSKILKKKEDKTGVLWNIIVKRINYKN